MVNFEAEIERLIGLVPPENGAVDPLVKSVGVVSLEKVDARYGENAEDPRAHHGVDHALETAEGSIEFTNLLHPFIEEEYREQIYDLDILAGVGHDIFLGSSVPGRNERTSAHEMVELASIYGSHAMQSASFKARLFGGIAVTEVKRSTDGNIKHPKLLEGGRDPFPFIITFADVDTIALRGTTAMLVAVRRLCNETHRNNPGQLFPRTYYDFLVEKEPRLLRKRLNDERMRGLVIPHFFPRHSDEVYEAMHEAYNSNIRSAYDFANAAAQVPENAEAIGLAIMQGDHAKVAELIGVNLPPA